MGFFKDFIIDKFPYYFREYDTYKDSEGKGIFTRFSETMSEEIDINVKPNMLNVINQKVAYDKNGEQINLDLLDYLNKDLGGVFRSVLSDEDYRKLLLNISDIYKCVGTQVGYNKLFFFFGYRVSAFTEILFNNYIHDQYSEPGLEDIIHDGDIGGEHIIHDHACENCINYEFVLSLIPGVTHYDLTPAGVIDEIVKLVEPLWANLVSVVIPTITTPIISYDDITLVSYDDVILEAEIV